MWIDVHCHLDHYSKPDSIVHKAWKKNVKIVVTNSENLASVVVNARLASKHQGVFYCAGHHPSGVQDKDSEYEAKSMLEKIDKHEPKFIAVGEVGLDWKWAKTEQVKYHQEEVFRRFIEMAKKEELPIIVHSRDATDYVLKILEDYKPVKVVLHWFTGSDSELVFKATEAGHYLSVDPRVITSKRIQENVRMINQKQLLLESDGPVSYSGKPADPSWIPKVGAKVADIFDMSVEDVEKLTTSNAQKLFAFDPKMLKALDKQKAINE